MLQTTIRHLLDVLHDRDVDDKGYRLYVVKDNSEALYVGQSTHIRARIRRHFRSSTPFGVALSRSRSESLQWEVILYTVDDCMDTIKRYFPYAPRESQYNPETRAMEDFAENALIHDLAPRYNQSINIGGYFLSSPFNQREIHPELQAHWETQREAKEEAFRKEERESLEYRESQVNSVCTFCGEHDRWVDREGKPCGVLDFVTVTSASTGETVFIPLVCHDCNDVIDLLYALKRKESRLRKIEKALAERGCVIKAVSLNDRIAMNYGIE